jgi:hypothetical protein
VATFNELLASQSPGVCWLLEVVDSTGTVLHRYGSHSASYGGNLFDGLIVRLGTIEKSFSNEALPAATTLELVLDNTSNACDWAVDRATVASVVFSSRFILYAGLYDATTPTASQPTLVVRKCGEYACLDFPRRNSAGEVSLPLVDDCMGRLANLAQAPTLNEWAAAGTSTTSNCPVHPSFNFKKLGNWDVPIQLAFGEAPLALSPCLSGYWAGTGIASPTSMCFPICATSQIGSPSAGDVVNYIYLDIPIGLQGLLGGATKLFVPSTGSLYGSSLTIWTLNRSATITKNGRSWQIIWLQFFTNDFGNFMLSKFDFLQNVPIIGGNLIDSLSAPESQFGLEAKPALHIAGYPWSARTIDFRPRQHPVDIVRDLISYYSEASSSDIDTTSFAKVRDFNYGLSASGVVQAAKSEKGQRVGNPIDNWNQNILQKTLGEICASSDMELFQLWGGTFGLSLAANGFEEQTTTWPSLDEERIVSVEEVIPSVGERWAPYNRIFLDTGEGDPLGPFDNATGLTDFGNRVLPRVLKSRWTLPLNTANYNPWTDRLVESTVRPVLKVRTHLDGLRFDLGDYLTTSWSRGGSAGPYTAAVFKVDAISFEPSSHQCVLTLVWQDDLYDEQPFLLDSESLLIKSTGSGGRLATVTDSSDIVSFSTGDIQAEGVLAGDFLVLTDSTLAGNNFTRYRALRILSVDGPKQVHVIDVDLDFDAPGGVDVSSWTIRTGFVNYPTSSSDPTNYPNDGDMYGKVANSGGVYTGSVPGNKLLNG